MTVQSGKAFIPDKKKGALDKGEREYEKYHISSGPVWVLHIV